MPVSVTVRDVSIDGRSLEETTIHLLTETISVRELIRSRVYQEVSEYNGRRIGKWSGLVHPAEAKQTSSSPPRRIKWEIQFRKAVAAFVAGSLLILVDGRQTIDLDEVFEIGPGTDISFLRLMPLIGG